jgi:hypothetical protein
MSASIFKIIRPFQVSDVSLVSSTVSATDPLASGAYNPATTYAAGALVQVDSPTFAFTASGYTFTAAAHGFAAGTLLKTSTSDTLPAGLTANTGYYMVGVATDTFRLSLSKGGVPIPTTSAGAGTHTATVTSHLVFESLQASNTGNTPHTSPLWWVETGATNRWKCLDLQTASQTYDADTMTYIIQTKGRVDSAYLGNVSATEVIITARESGGGAIVYGPSTYSLQASVSVSSYWSWFYEPIRLDSEFVDIDFPPYLNLELEITLNNTGGVVQVGTILVGLSKSFGTTMNGATFSINDYSVKSADDFGNISFTERAYAKRGNFQVVLDNSAVDGVGYELAKYRATPIVYVASTAYNSAIFYGKYNSFSTLVAYDSYSICSIEIEGLT